MTLKFYINKMNIFKIIAATIAFSVCTFEGYRQSRELKARARFLAETELMLERFSIGIRCAGRTSDELLEKERGQFARLVREFNAECGDMREAWDKACDTLPNDREETALLRELGRTFGAADRESTLKLLERCGAEISSMKTAAEEDCSKRGKAMLQVGTLCGIGVAVLIV